MAFTDLIGKPHVEAMLAASIELRSATGVLTQTYYIGDRYIELPNPEGAGNVVVSGIVSQWHEFGYVADAEEFGAPVSDGRISFTLSNISQWGQSIAFVLNYYEPEGGRIRIYQYLKGTSGWESRRIFVGRVERISEMDDGGFSLQFQDLGQIAGVVPPEEVTKVDFPNCPDESVGIAIPLVFGSFMEKAGTNPYLWTWYGIGNCYGVPGIKIDTRINDDAQEGKYRIASHMLKSITPSATGPVVALHEPDVSYPSTFYVFSVGTDNQISHADVALLRPLYVRLCGFPAQQGTGCSATNPYKAWDQETGTYVSMTASQVLSGKLEDLPELGSQPQFLVSIWIKSVSGGNVRFGLHDGSNWVGDTPYSDVSSSGSKTLQVLINSQPPAAWNFQQLGWEIRVETLAGVTAEIYAIRVALEYYPNRRPSTGPYPFSKLHMRSHGMSETSWQRFARSRRPASGKGVTHQPVVISYCEGMADDASGTYTGVANALIENGADIARYLLTNHSDLSSSEIETGSGIGNFTTARTELGSYHKLALWVGGEKQPILDVLLRLCRECRAMPTYNSNGKLGMVVMDPTPAPDYRGTSDVFEWEQDHHFIASTFRCGRTPIGNVANRVYVDFDYSIVQDTFRKSTWITPDGSDNGNGARDEQDLREIQAGYSEDRFGSGREFRLKAYEVHNQGCAKVLRNFWFDTIHRPRVWAQFEAGIHACDLSTGNVIRFGDTTINGYRIPCPDVSSHDWDDIEFYVQSAIRLGSPNEVPRYRIRVIEAIEPGTAAEWIAAADDS